MTDFLVIGGRSVGCVLATERVRRQADAVTLLEAGPSEQHPLVALPFGLIWLMKSRRDWRYQTTPQTYAGNRQIAVPRGRMLGGSASINSMVWFRGRAADVDGWGLDGWRWRDVQPVFETPEQRLKPSRMTGGHPLVEGLATMPGSNGQAITTPEFESAGGLAHHRVKGRRNSAAGAYLRPAADVTVKTGARVDRVLWDGDRVTGVRLTDGCTFVAANGVILCAGSLASASILMRSGLEPAQDLRAHGIDLGLFTDESDPDTMAHSIERLRTLLKRADFGALRRHETTPGEATTGAALKTHIRNPAGTAYHPVGTQRLGGPVTARCGVKNTRNLWVADASLIPQVTSANTNAPLMMIGWKGAANIAEDAA